VKESISPEALIGRKNRFYVIAAALLALFLGALDALVMGAAMPTIVADLGGLHLYSWIFSAYLLTRAVSLPVFGKLCDLFENKTLFVISIIIFLSGSVLAGTAQSMSQLIISRALQGIGAGGNFALTYIVLADLSSPEKRGKMMSFASFVWGLASLLGPPFGGFVVNFFSWRWIFFINLPLGGFSLLGVLLYLVETREKKKETSIDYLGGLMFSATILGLLTVFLIGGRNFDWLSPQILVLFLITAGAGVAFYHIEKHAQDPFLSFRFFNIRGFRIGNGASFLSSFSIFSLFAFGPLFIQGALGKTPAQLGVAMVPLSLGWSVGALFCGQLVNRIREKPAAFLGSLLLATGCSMAVTFSSSTSLIFCSITFAVAGLGMGFVSIATLLTVQSSLDVSDLGVATASHQFARTLGGTIGIGVSGSLLTSRLEKTLDAIVSAGDFPISIYSQLRQSIENLFRPEIQTLLPDNVLDSLQASIGQGVMTVFWMSLVASLFCFVLVFRLPDRRESTFS